MHAQFDLSHRQKAFLSGQEGVLLIGMDDFTRHPDRFALLERSRGQRQVDQIVIMVDPDVLHRLQLYLSGVGVVGPHLLAHMQLANWLFTLCSRNPTLMWGHCTAP